MKEISVIDAKARLLELLTDVEQGAQYIITRRGVAVARLVGKGAVRRCAVSQRQRVIAAFANLKALREGVAVEENLKDTIAHGRD